MRALVELMKMGKAAWELDHEEQKWGLAKMIKNVSLANTEHFTIKYIFSHFSETIFSLFYFNS